MDIGRLGVWCATDGLSADEAARFAQQVEGWGYGALWIPEAVGRNALVHAAWLLANTRTLVVATGIANIYGRDAQSTAAGQLALNEQSGGRFLLGLGVSHRPLVEDMRGHQYDKPVPAMRRYLEAMQAAAYIAPRPAQPVKTVIAALGPRMLELASRATDGAHPYFVTPEHTANARQILGPERWLCPEQKVVLETDPKRARAAARRAMAPYLGLENYLNNLRRFGFDDADFADGGSDRLVDAIVAWGDEAALRARIQAHWDAGADHVCIQPVDPDGDGMTSIDRRVLELLAPARR